MPETIAPNLHNASHVKWFFPVPVSVETYCPNMWTEGTTTVDYLLARGRLERIAPTGLADAADVLQSRAAQRSTTAALAQDTGDVEGAFVNAYDAYRMAAEALLIRQGLRPTNGQGAHQATEETVSAQFEARIRVFQKPTFERFRRTRHAAQYFDPTSPEITASDADWAIKTASDAVLGSWELLRSGDLGVFSPR